MTVQSGSSYCVKRKVCAKRRGESKSTTLPTTSTLRPSPVRICSRAPGMKDCACSQALNTAACGSLFLVSSRHTASMLPRMVIFATRRSPLTSLLDISGSSLRRRI
jgi:hypothetical protein